MLLIFCISIQILAQKQEEERKRKQEEDERKRKQQEEEDRKRKQQQQEEDERRKKEEREKQEREKREKEEREKKEKEEHERKRHEKKEKKERDTKKETNNNNAAQPTVVAPLEAIGFEEDPKEEEEGLEAAFPERSFDKPLEYHQALPQEVYSSFDKLQTFARSLNITMAQPTFVLVGFKQQGKATVVDAFFGDPLGHVGVATRRPIFYNLVNNSTCEKPKIVIKKDVPHYEQDLTVDRAQVSAVLRERQGVASNEAIVVQIESNSVINMTLIDAPSLLTEDESGVTIGDREALVLGLTRPTNRHLVAVESTNEWAKLRITEFIKKVDPELSRTSFVFTKLQKFLSTINTTREVNKYFANVIPNVKSFFISMPSTAIREQNLASEPFKRKVYQAYLRDMQALESLQYDKRNETLIGTQQLRRYLLATTWREHQSSVPKILNELRVLKRGTTNQILDLEKQLINLDSSRLRVIASTYVVDFLQAVERLIGGTTEGNPAVNGQTLEEEKISHGGDWIDSYNRLIRYDPEEANIPYWEHRLYGGQQFERLLSEFNYVSRQCKIDEREITMEIIGTATGINKLNNVPNYVSAGCDLASQKLKQSFTPLIERLTHRAAEIFKRVADIAERLLEAKKKKAAALENVSDVSRYSYFVYYVRDLYSNFVENVASVCKDKCLDEFLAPRTIYWEISNRFNNTLPTDRNDSNETRQAVLKLATDIFNEQRERISHNVMLKFYNFFLVPLQVQLMNEIQSKINHLTDTQLENYFQLAATRETLKDAIDKQKEHSRLLIEKDNIFQQLSTSFSHPLHRLEQ